MNTIKKTDFVSSIADSLQYISHYHPLDFVKAMHEAYKRERNQAAKDAIGQILINSKMSAVGKRPICQDTGIVNAFVKVGADCRFDTDMTIQEMVDEATDLGGVGFQCVCESLLHPNRSLRGSAYSASGCGTSRNHAPCAKS